MDLSGNQTKLYRALPIADHPPAAPAQLAEATGLGYSTVTRLLRELAEAGLAAKDGTGWLVTDPAAQADPPDDPHGCAPDEEPDRDTAGDDTSGGAPDAPTDPDATVRPREEPGPDSGDPEHGDDEPAAPAAGGDDAAPRQRLRKGELPKQVLATLRAHPGKELSPHRLTKLIGARSSGAVGNACDRLVAGGLAELATDKPRTYRATAAD